MAECDKTLLSSHLVCTALCAAEIERNLQQGWDTVKGSTSVWNQRRALRHCSPLNLTLLEVKEDWFHILQWSPLWLSNTWLILRCKAQPKDSDVVAWLIKKTQLCLRESSLLSWNLHQNFHSWRSLFSQISCQQHNIMWTDLCNACTLYETKDSLISG